MKGYFHAALLVLCALTLVPALAFAAGTPSSARVTLTLATTGEQRSFASLSDAFDELYKQYGSIGFYSTKVLDYSTYGSKHEQLVDAERAYFLVDADGARDAGAGLQVVAFASRAAARSAQKKIGGQLRDFNDAWDAVAASWGVDMHPKAEQQVAAKAAPLARHEVPIHRQEQQPEEYCPT